LLTDSRVCFTVLWSYTLRNIHVGSVTPRDLLVACVPLLLLGVAASVRAQNPSGVYSPVHLNSALPYRVELRPYSMVGADVPTLHSYAVGEYDGKFLFVTGRTNGLHGFDGFANPEENFPPQSQNRDVWVIDFASRQTWHRPLDGPSSGLSEAQVLSLSPTNTQSHRLGDTLYVTGGYGKVGDGEFGAEFGTFNTLTAIDLPGLGDWVMNGTGMATDHIRQISSPAQYPDLFRVTGGAMYAIDGRTHLVFGQDFEGLYTPFATGEYIKQVRSFDIVDNGVSLSIQNVATTTPDDNYHRRDLNVFPVLRPDGSGGLEQGLTALAGVFTPADDAWSVPVEIDANGNPTMADPNDPNTFQQGMNIYHSAKLGLFSESSGEMHELLFGGITLHYLDTTLGTIETDFGLPFVNDITAVVVDADGNYSQHHLGMFPELFDGQNRLLRFGTNADFLAAEGIPTFTNGVIQFDALSGESTLGYIFGGIVANAPHTRQNPGELSAGSNYVFEVVLIIVPEPTAISLLVCGSTVLIALHRRVARSVGARKANRRSGCRSDGQAYCRTIGHQRPQNRID
jgi:hypothetical protein